MKVVGWRENKRIESHQEPPQSEDRSDNRCVFYAAVDWGRSQPTGCVPNATLPSLGSVPHHTGIVYDGEKQQASHWFVGLYVLTPACVRICQLCRPACRSSVSTVSRWRLSTCSSTCTQLLLSSPPPFASSTSCWLFFCWGKDLCVPCCSVFGIWAHQRFTSSLIHSAIVLSVYV